MLFRSVGLAELASALLADERVTAIGLYVEGIDDAPAFAALAEAARSAGKGVVCIKVGKTALSRSAAASHTAALAGGGAASSAFLRQCGVAEVATLAELVEALKIFHVHGPQIGRRLCSLSCSGGEAGLVADLAAPFGLDFEPPSQRTREQLGELLGPIVDAGEVAQAKHRREQRIELRTQFVFHPSLQFEPVSIKAAALRQQPPALVDHPHCVG